MCVRPHLWLAADQLVLASWRRRLIGPLGVGYALVVGVDWSALRDRPADVLSHARPAGSQPWLVRRHRERVARRSRPITPIRSATSTAGAQPRRAFPPRWGRTRAAPASTPPWARRRRRLRR